MIAAALAAVLVAPTSVHAAAPPRLASDREFGVGYVHKGTRAGGVAVDERVYAPFGDDPVLLHDVTLRNTTSSTRRASWFEYWDVNPYLPGAHSHLGLGAPSYDAPTK